MRTFTNPETGKVVTEQELEAEIRYVLEAWVHKRTDAEGYLDGMRPGIQCTLVWKDTELLSPDAQRALYKEYVPKLKGHAHDQALFASRLFRMGELEWLEVARRMLQAETPAEYRIAAEWVTAFHQGLGQDACADVVRRAIRVASVPGRDAEIVLDLLALGPNTPLWRSVLEHAEALQTRRLFARNHQRTLLALFLDRMDRLSCDYCGKKKRPYPLEILVGPMGSMCRRCLHARRVRNDSRCALCSATTHEPDVPLCAGCEASTKEMDDRFAALRAQHRV